MMVMNNQRLSSIDIFRGFAVLLMIVAHIPTQLPEIIQRSANIFAPPFFLMISGFSYDLFLASREKKRVKPTLIYLESFIKGCLIYLIPLLPYIIACIFLPKYTFQIFHWGIFQVIGVGYIVGFFVPLNIASKSTAVILVFVSNFLMRNVFQETFSFLITDSFPLFPWIAYFLFGRIVYDLSQNIYNRKISYISYSVLAFLVSISIFNINNGDFDPLTRGQIPMFLLLSSLQVVILFLLIVFVDLLKQCQKLFQPIENFGKIAFTLYYAHLLIIYSITYTAQVFFDRQVTHTYNLFILIFTIIFLMWAERKWVKYDYKFGFEWFIKTTSKKILNVFA